MASEIIGQTLSLISSSIEVYERGIKTYKKSIFVGVIRYIIQALAYMLIGGINGVIITLMAIVRHLFMYNKKFTSKVMCLWLAVSAILNIYFASSVVDMFPFIATVQFTLMVRKQNAVVLKWAQVINSGIWIIYNVAHQMWVYTIFNVILVAVGLIRIKKGVEG